MLAEWAKSIACDTRLLRDLALKVLPSSFTNDPDRFEQEARAVTALNHPNNYLRLRHWLWTQDSEGSTPQPMSPEGGVVRRRGCISPDGTRVAAGDPEGKITIYSIGEGKPLQVTNTEPGEEPIQWTADGKSLLVGRREVPARVFVVDLATKQRRLLQGFMPADPTGLFRNGSPNFSRDLKSYVYTSQRITSDLYIVDGLK